MLPLFLSGSRGRLFCIYHEPVADADYRGELIFVPPFAEELNRSRHTVARAARTFARRGIGVLLLDLFGTGDSEGGFDEARWDVWGNDVMVAERWLRERGAEEVGVWGLRLGALLAADVAAANPNRFTRQILWQPVARGRNYLSQFLRIGMMSAVIGGAPTAETSELRKRLNAGETVNVAGYPLAPEIARDLDPLELARMIPHGDMQVLWCEVTASSPAFPGSSRKVVDAWRDRGVTLNTVLVRDESFWSTQTLEPIWADRLIIATADAL